MHKNDTLQLSKIQKEKYGIKEVSEIYTIYYVIKVNKFDDIARDKLDEWIYFLKHSEIKDEFKAKGLEQAKEILRINNLSEKEKKDFYNYVEEWRIRESEIETALAKGEQKTKNELLPIIEQKKQALMNSAKAMLQAGIPINEIQQITELTIDEIEKL